MDFERRFGGVARSYGAAGLARFRAAHVCVIGIGGVGSWAVEALARSAIGRLTLIDLDNVAESNVNRQIHALGDEFGKAKVTAMAQRIHLINPECRVTEVEAFIEPGNLASLLPPAVDFIIDCIDGVKAKAALIAWCRDQHIPLITVGAAGGQTDPTQVEVRDLNRTEQEPLLARVRKVLRRQYGFPRGTKHKFGLEAVFSMEAVQRPESEACAVAEGRAADDAETETPTAITGLNCAGYGSSMCVTASFGLVAASRVLNHLAKNPSPAASVTTEAAATLQTTRQHPKP